MKKILSFIYIFLFHLVFLTTLSQAAETVCFYHTDAAGTPLAMTNSSGAVVWKEVYRPFGEKQTITGTATNTKQFIGKDEDPETGLHSVGVRYMKDETGRFVSPDPVGAVDPKSRELNIEILMNPQRLNLYAYGNNNSYRFIDPTGLIFVTLDEGVDIAKNARTWKDTPYYPGGGKQSTREKADCSGAVWRIYQEMGYEYEYAASANFPSSSRFKEVPDNKPQDGDVGWFDGHMLIYDSGAGFAKDKHGNDVPANTETARGVGKLYGPAPLSWYEQRYGSVRWYRYDKP